jgi:hypothetical protein
MRFAKNVAEGGSDDPHEEEDRGGSVDRHPIILKPARRHGRGVVQAKAEEPWASPRSIQRSINPLYDAAEPHRSHGRASFHQ